MRFILLQAPLGGFSCRKGYCIHRKRVAKKREKAFYSLVYGSKQEEGVFSPFLHQALPLQKILQKIERVS